MSFHTFDLDVDANFNLKISPSVPRDFRSDVEVNPNRILLVVEGSEGDGRKRIVSFCRTNQGEAGTKCFEDGLTQINSSSSSVNSDSQIISLGSNRDGPGGSG
jgi:hypothetical protein